MSKSIAIIVGLVLLIALLLFSMTYTVRYNEVAIRTRFGKTTADNIEREPGLKFRLPLFADKITSIDTRLQLRESGLETIQTTDGQQVMVKAFLMWQVRKEGDGPLKFFESYPSGIDEANQWMVDQFRTAIRSGLTRHSFNDLIGPQSRVADAELAIKNELASLVDRGIEPVTVGISQLILPPKTTTAVLRRMEATRSYISETERYKGDAEASGIQNRADAAAAKIRSFAEQRAVEIRAAGNKDAEKYLAAMGQDEGLAIFLSWLDALQSSLASETTLVIPTAWAPYHLLKLDTPMDARGIPQPTAEQGRIAADEAKSQQAGDPGSDGAEAPPAPLATPSSAKSKPGGDATGESS